MANKSNKKKKKTYFGLRRVLRLSIQKAREKRITKSDNDVLNVLSDPNELPTTTNENRYDVTTADNDCTESVVSEVNVVKAPAPGVSNETTHEDPKEYAVLKNVTPSFDSCSQNEECSEEELTIEVDNSANLGEANINGRRIVDIVYFTEKFKDISNHSSLFSCNSSNLILKSESRKGLSSILKYQCNLCRKTFKIDTIDPKNNENIDINNAAVSGIVTTGIGYSQFQELMTAVEIPVFSESFYFKIQNNNFQQWEDTAAQTMEEAAAREREAAIAEGRLKNGVPVIDVMCDGVYSARSYGNNYRALSGAAAIIGRKFGEVLFLGVKNKYCLVCSRAEKQKETPKDHKCYKNFEGASSAMESEIITEGFKQSLNMYGLIYARVVADGDSSTYKKIITADPYPDHVVTKIECRNHILRNLCNKMQALKKETKYPLAHRKFITDKAILSIRKVVVKSVEHHKKSSDKRNAVNSLRSDIYDSAAHAFGDHTKCKDYYCTKDKTVSSVAVAELENSMLWFRVKGIIRCTASKSHSLIEDVDTNDVERYNSIVAKFVGGKRVNFSTRRSYQARCSAAVVAFNTRKPLHTLHKNILGHSPSSRVKKMEEVRIKQRQKANKVPRKKNRNRKFASTSSKQQHDYGSSSKAPDMLEEDMEIAKDNFLINLEALTADKEKINRDTILQRESDQWIEIRRNLITASSFAKIVKRRDSGNYAPLVKDVLYKKNIAHVASVAHGIENEELALQQLSQQENLLIEPCGLFIDKKYCFIGATPDGIVGKDTIVEVKCPMYAYRIGMQESIENNKIQIIKYDKKRKTENINKNSDWYYQVQGQLHVSGRSKCIFGIWGGEKQLMKVIYILKDDKFWEEKMEPKIVSFYINHLLPEIIDPRHKRGLPIRGAKNKENK